VVGCAGTGGGTGTDPGADPDDGTPPGIDGSPLDGWPDPLSHAVGGAGDAGDDGSDDVPSGAPVVAGQVFDGPVRGAFGAGFAGAGGVVPAIDAGTGRTRRYVVRVARKTRISARVEIRIRRRCRAPWCPP
jgi:hypothetical protein